MYFRCIPVFAETDINPYKEEKYTSLSFFARKSLYIVVISEIMWLSATYKYLLHKL